ncbi:MULTISPECIES: hypothetical protein [unclassified Mesorhizobium]|uniref:hypothetical protein n=1 Tax=unclassified Mesorhizobium TaxID=325217 RepID=UPI0003CF0BE9|nr:MULTISPECIES: hypothetical protein [unclassified Mesorhizobium]ESX26199.1 hypothetical protein X767_07165 [Mesorhizobium sp. LSJC264A00]ESX95421.1 hypothetical protein X754_10260 [Mesorhizobium sp. LNJC403B00]
MTERKKIEERLRKKEQEVASLEEKTKVARVYVQALRDILKMLATDGDDNNTDAETVLRTGSAVADARHVILKKRAPVHINEILEALGREATREAKASLTSSLAAYVRRGEIFTRPAPNTFGLAELGHETIEEEAAEPPPNFGRPTPPRPSRPPEPEPDEDIPF